MQTINNRRTPRHMGRIRTQCASTSDPATGRFALVPSLKAELTVKTPADRNPGKRWVQGGPVPVVAEAVPGAAIRLGYARCSTVGQELQSQLDLLARADCTRVFSEKISTRVKGRPELEKALTLAREFKAAAPNQPVILTVVEMKRFARNAAELMNVLHPASGRHPTGTPLRSLAGCVRPERGGSHRVRRPGGGRRGGAGRYPGEDVGGAGHCGP
ncbi:hypothetical protein SCWH03_32880 [Streptomyces pacificus]|uniref:Resolvase/invertase-type recombinase catalytic domain-containing protein n=1 Tax=Streptomyces pacificus TaxID=2705029 RepID=A0A6A0AYJ0_9ACTN|nr:hypothetical protein SCWH03_32880 [Streptomyces pacificus]